MARQKGDGRGRLGGRAKGTANKTTTEIRAAIAKLITSPKAWRRLESDFESLPPAQRVMLTERFLGYILPKLQATAAVVDIVDPGNRLSREELEEIRQAHQGMTIDEARQLYDPRTHGKHLTAQEAAAKLVQMENDY